MFKQLSLFGFFRSTTRRKAKVVRVRRGAVQNSTELHSLWCRIRQEWFPDRPELDAYSVRWSTRRQKRTLAVCYPTQRCVKVARELNYPEHIHWLPPLLYHEMCHAALGQKRRADNKNSWHGPEFRALERRHPGISNLDAWIKRGGWLSAVRSDRARRAHVARRRLAA